MGEAAESHCKGDARKDKLKLFLPPIYQSWIPPPHSQKQILGQGMNCKQLIWEVILRDTRKGLGEWDREGRKLSAGYTHKNVLTLGNWARSHWRLLGSCTDLVRVTPLEAFVHLPHLSLADGCSWKHWHPRTSSFLEARRDGQVATGESSVCKGMDSAGHGWGSETGEVTIGLGRLMVSGDLDKSSFSDLKQVQ